jgi:hypothetical protein
MGEEIRTDGPVLFTADVIGTGPIERLELIRDDRLLFTVAGDGDRVLLEYTDRSCPRGWHYFYLRVTQVDGEFAWSSPIWVRQTKESTQDPHSLPLWNDDGLEPSVELAPHEARRHEDQLMNYLKTEEDWARWPTVRAVRVVPSSMGHYVLLHSFDRKHVKPVHFKLFLDYEDVVLRMDLGLRDFGQFPNPSAAAFVDYDPGQADER